MTARVGLEYDVVALASLKANEYETLRSRVYERLESFECSRSEHLQKFARGGVHNWEAHGHSRTYVVLTEDAEDIEIAGFFTIGMTYLDLTAASKTARAKLTGNIPMEATGAYCIAELARNDKYDAKQLPGSVLLDEAKAVVKRARELIAGRFLVVDAQEVVFENLYAPAGFKQISIASPPAGMEDRNFITACAVIKDW